MAAEPHRPSDVEYWIAPWSRVLFSGDLFEAIPFGNQPTTVLTDEEAEPVKHYLGEIAFGYGLLISPTCDMYSQLAAEPSVAHPFRVLVPILPLKEVAAATDAVERNLGLLRSRDSLTPYMYLPGLEGVFGESVACLFRPTLVADDFLVDPPRRMAQMHPEGRRQLKIKLARYWARVDVPRDDIPLHERGEDEVRADKRASQSLRRRPVGPVARTSRCFRFHANGALAEMKLLAALPHGERRFRNQRPPV